MAVPVLELKNISKSFFSQIANDDISLVFHKGEIHSILGENGAGKTTLMNIITGLYHPDSGDIYLGGQVVKFHSARKAAMMGIGMVHQHFSLSEKHSVYENIIINMNHLPFVPNKKKISEKIIALCTRYSFPLSLETQVGQLSVSECQKVEIIKALINDPKIIIFDEPTALLSKHETENFFSVIKQLKQDGYTIIFISHKLDEVMSISDRITILSKGRKKGTYLSSEVSKKSLAKKMIGREILFTDFKHQFVDKGDLLLLRGATIYNDKGIVAVEGLDLTVKKGEVFGIAGISGNGQLELAEGLFGLRPMEFSKYEIDSVAISNPLPSSLMANGVRLIPADRHHVGVASGMNIYDNIIINQYGEREFSKYSILRKKNISIYSNKLVDKFNIKIHKMTSCVKNLSGGNLQKVIVAREVEKVSKLLIAVFPTRGLDIGAIEQIHKILIEEQKKGLTIIVISEDLEELMTLSDRIGVMFKGSICKIWTRDSVDINEMSMAMGGEF